MRAESLVKSYSLLGTRLNKFIEQVRLNKTDDEIKLALELYKGEDIAVYASVEIPKPINLFCEYDNKKAPGPWDVCSICGQSRFYQNGQKCKEKKSLIT